MHKKTLNKKSLLSRTLGVTAAAAALSIAGAMPASAHVTVKTDNAAAGSYTVLQVSVPHGCDGSATTKVSIKIPEGINMVTPTRNSFYSVEKVMKDLPEPITDAHGNKITQRVDEVVYTAKTPLPADQRDVFELSTKLPEDAAGKTLYFPTVQKCEKGETAWVQMPAEGQDPHELENPSPELEVTEAVEDGHGHAHGAHGHNHADGHDHGHEHGSESKSVDAQPASQSGEGNNTPLVVTSLIVGILGLVTGVWALLRSRKKA